MDRELLMSYGLDCDQGLKNCMGNAVFYKKVLSMFLQDQCLVRAKAAYLEGNRKELFSRMHELKGISGNAALTGLYAATVPLVELLRNDGGAQAEVDSLFAAVETAYDRACQGIALALAQE